MKHTTLRIPAAGSGDGPILNPTGEEHVVDMVLGAADLENANNYHALLAPGRVVGQELILRLLPTPSSFDPTELNGPETANADKLRIYGINGVDRALGPGLNSALFQYDINASPPQNAFGAQPGLEFAVIGQDINYNIPPCAFLRWTGSYWLVQSATVGVTRGADYDS